MFITAAWTVTFVFTIFMALVLFQDGMCRSVFYHYCGKSAMGMLVLLVVAIWFTVGAMNYDEWWLVTLIIFDMGISLFVSYRMQLAYDEEVRQAKAQEKQRGRFE